MSSSGAIRAGRAFVELFADNSKLVRGLRQSEHLLKAWGTRVRNIGAKIFAAGGGMLAGLFAVTKFAEGIGSALNDMSQRTGATVEALSALGFAAEQNGTDLESVGNGLKFLQKNMVAALQGSKEAQKTFAGLGVSLEELQGLSPDEQFLRIADAIARIPDPAQRTAAAMKVFGRSGAELLPLLNQGAAGIKGFMDEAKRLGVVVSTEDAQALDDFGDSLASLWGTIKGTAVVLGAALAPTFTKIATLIQRAAKTVQDWISQNRGLITGAAIAAAVLTGVGAAIIGVGIAIKIAAVAAGALATIFGALTSPIGLIVAAVVGLGIYLAHTTEVMSQVQQFLGKAFGAVAKDAIDAFGVIRDALAGGDIQGAATVLWSFLKLQWANGVAALNKAWQPAAKFFLDTWHAAIKGVADLMLNLVFAVERAWDSLKKRHEAGKDELAREAVKDNIESKVEAARADAFKKARNEHAVARGVPIGIDGNPAMSSAEDVSAGNAAANEAERKVRNQNRFTGDFLEEEIAKRKQNEQAATEALERQHREALDENQAILDGKFAKSEDDANKAKAQAEEDLKKAREEFEKAKSNARRPNGPEALKNPNLPGLPDFDPAGFAQRKQSVTGTFSSAMLGQTFGGTDRLLDVNKQMERHLRKMAAKERKAEREAAWGP